MPSAGAELAGLLDSATPTWKARWAIYADETTAVLAESPGPLASIVSGSTATFHTEGEALVKGEEDAIRSEAVLSGTYRT
jgi:hypothetical protein